MGYSDGVYTHIGIRIQLCKLIPQINESNYNHIKTLCKNGFIEDSNDCTNEVYNTMIEKFFTNVRNSNIPSGRSSLEESEKLCLYHDFQTFKDEFTNFAKNRGTYDYSRHNRPKETFQFGSLYEQYLLYPIEQVISNNRSNDIHYSREGINGTSRNIDTINMDEIKKKIMLEYGWLNDFEIVFTIYQQFS